MEPLELLAAIAIVVVLLLVLRGVARAGLVTVHDYERGLRFSRGRLRGLVAPGVHLAVPPLNEIRVLDARPTALVIEGQEVMTADGVPVKVSLAIRYVVADPVAAITGDADFRRAIYLLLQLTLRDALAGRTLEEALASRREIGPAVQQACASDVATLGVELLAVEVRDLMVPAELKRAFASVIAARKEGEAALERVRSETAALRNLANAGRMVEDNPGLLQLRILQQLAASDGNTIMLGMPDGATRAVGPAVNRGRRRTDRPSGGGDGGATTAGG